MYIYIYIHTYIYIYIHIYIYILFIYLECQPTFLRIPHSPPPRPLPPPLAAWDVKLQWIHSCPWNGWNEWPTINKHGKNLRKLWQHRIRAWVLLGSNASEKNRACCDVASRCWPTYLEVLQSQNLGPTMKPLTSHLASAAILRCLGKWADQGITMAKTLYIHNDAQRSSFYVYELPHRHKTS